MAKYSDARNVQLVIALLKKYGIRNVIASPGTTNVPFVYSVQNDSFFRVRSAFDERGLWSCRRIRRAGRAFMHRCHSLS